MGMALKFEERPPVEADPYYARMYSAQVREYFARHYANDLANLEALGAYNTSVRLVA